MKRITLDICALEIYYSAHKSIVKELTQTETM